MAEPANPITFDQTPDTRFFMCRSCRNHVLSRENLRFEDMVFKVIISPNAVNVRASDVDSCPLLLHVPLVEVFCNGCGRNIGYKFVMVAEPTQFVQEGWFMLTQNRMLYWNGNQVVYADTKKPVEDN